MESYCHFHREQNKESVKAALELLNDQEADLDPAKVKKDALNLEGVYSQCRLL